ncbi:hypothetical protein [Robertmurraya siralis]|uniref:hypothetical protein n=1 Tax=Robertmurraya siralis TaxID=77777 RepID=UPI001BB3D6E8|nr:hypothetical protein [Robertmurraya siralis]
MRKFLITVFCFLVIMVLPIFLWFLEDDKQLSIAVIDKTVPNETYREHKGIIWLLNHLKYSKKDKSPYSLVNDYYGFIPDDKQKSYKVSKLPNDYSNYDVIYIADTYGVYEQDLPWYEQDRRGARSEKIYGGLTEEEWGAIVNRLSQNEKSLLVAEYNTFASPTNEEVRKKVADFLGLNWSGWTGRYFQELNPAKNKEIPQWIVDEFGDSWRYEGEGFILVNDINYQVVVLENNKHLKDKGISIRFTDQGSKQFGLTKSPNYEYWFDIVTAKSGSEVLAEYEWSLTEAGMELLNENEIPTEFAAVLKNGYGSATTYYFAGDYNDIEHVPSFYQMKGLQGAYSVLNTFSDAAFYWKTYVPMMTSILESFESNRKKDNSVVDIDTDKLNYGARIENNSFEILKDNEWVRMRIKGVNLGMGKPGYFPGEAAITEEEYYRWFEQIGEMNANAIRVYTLHPPGFYDALKRYNESHEEKIYVFHGVWMNEEKIEESLDVFDKDILQEFQHEMKKIVDVVHGNNNVQPEAGHASGIYRSDISEYVIGWVIGIEWYPYMVLNMNEEYTSIGDFNGQYFETKDAKPFEHWLAKQLEFLVDYEIKHYQAIRPVSFTNWVTTDILEHPAEPNEQEDLVGVNPNVIYTKNEMNLTKQFASYHIYPYYPDFFNFEESYQTYVDHRGEFNSYAAYLSELHDAHRIPILVAEFGVPSSRGLTHENPFGWNQGFLSEKEQGEITSHLYEDIVAEELLGGLVFTWQDEWFKRTWNTMDYDNPDRRPYWSNAQTNEQQFGLLSFDTHKIQVDGVTEDWKTAPIYEKQDGQLKAMYVDHDERYLYIRLDINKVGSGHPVILLDVVPNQGNHHIAQFSSLSFKNGIDFYINLDEHESSIRVDQYYDFFRYFYSKHLNLIDAKAAQSEKNTGFFSPIHYALNRELYLPQQKKTLPFASYETGKLRQGNGNPEAEDYDSLADYYISENGVVEMRIPWLLLQAKDPSQKEFIGDLYADGVSASKFIKEIFAGVMMVDKEGRVTDAFPSVEGQQLGEMKGYSWENWDMPNYKERLKQSYYIVKEVFEKH